MYMVFQESFQSALKYKTGVFMISLFSSIIVTGFRDPRECYDSFPDSLAIDRKTADQPAVSEISYPVDIGAERCQGQLRDFEKLYSEGNADDCQAQQTADAEIQHSQFNA